MMMPYLRNDDLILMNDLIYSIYSIPNDLEMRKHFLKVLRLLIPYHCASFFLADLKLENPLVKLVEVDVGEEKQVSYDEYYFRLDYARKFNQVLNPVVFRETDLFDTNKREKTEYFNDYLQPDVCFVSSVFLANQEGLKGNINLCRKKRENDFEERDLFIFRLLTPHLLSRLCQIKQSSLITNECGDTHIYHIANRYKLTNREVDVAKLLLHGSSNFEISDKLYVSLGTVKKHMSSIFEKTGIKNRTQLVNLFINQQKKPIV